MLSVEEKLYGIIVPFSCGGNPCAQIGSRDNAAIHSDNTRLSGIYRILDSAIEGTFVYPQSTQAIGMFEMGMSLGSLGL